MGELVNIAYFPENNTFNGISNIELNIKDIKMHQDTKKPPGDS
jgi:hypothetical protein